MLVSVVICTYTPAMYDHFEDAVRSVLSQSYEDVELIIVVDGDESVFERSKADFGGEENVNIYMNEENQGLLLSRNKGVERSNGDVVAFIDDDAIAEERWIESLVETYEAIDAIAVGGKMAPLWVDGKPPYLPEEFYWLVGVTHRGFANGFEEVRNTFGSNISFQREVFQELDGFDPEIGGRKGDANLQGGETELCARMRARFGRGVMYNPDAVVRHKVFAYRTDTRWLFERAFWQGYSKRAMKTLLPGSGDEETQFLGSILGKFLPERLGALVRNPSIMAIGQLVMLLTLTGAVGLGYLYGAIKW